MKHQLLTRYFELKKLPPDIRYQQLKRWERDVEKYLSNQSDNVIELSIVNSN